MKKALPHEETLIRQIAIEALIKGYSNSDLLTLLIKDYPSVEVEVLETLIRSAHIKIRESTLIDLDKIIPIHIELYEKIYKEMDELYCVPGKLRAMRQKEKIVGLLKEENTVEIYNETNIEIEGEAQYDISKLNAKQQKKLEEYLKRVMSK